MCLEDTVLLYGTELQGICSSLPGKFTPQRLVKGILNHLKEK